MVNKIRMMLLMIVMTVSASALYAQNTRQRLTREQLSEVQARHIAESMAMDDATAKRFVSTYTQCQKEIWALGPRPGKKGGMMTDEETKEALKAKFDHSQKILDIRKKYYGIYSDFLTQKQIQRVYQLEKQTMNQLKKRGHRKGVRHGAKKQRPATAKQRPGA